MSEPETVTVIEASYIATAEGDPPKFIGLWYQNSVKANLLLFPLDRTDILSLEKGDKGTLTKRESGWDFMLRGN